ncbi:MAG TPA: GYF domain-containing protein [Polyangiaceae bacterium]
MFYLNRTGQPEGPFSEQQLVEMIRNGQLREGWIAAQGQNEWSPLASVPALAQALAGPAASGGYAAPTAGGYSPPTAPGTTEASAPMHAYGTSPMAPQQGHPAHAAPQGYGAPGGPGYPGAPQYGGYGAPPGQAPAPGSQKKAGSKLPLIVGGGVALLVLVVGGAWAAYAFLFKADGPRVAAILPQSTEAYVEVPNVRAAALAIGKARHLKEDPSKDDAWAKDQAAVVARSFGIDETTAIALALAQRSFGAGVSGFQSQPKGAFVLQFDATSPVEKLLASPRFKQEGALGSKGKRYSLGPKAASAPAGEGWTRALEEMLDRAQTDTQLNLGWWESGGVLALGSPEFLMAIAAVQDGQQPPLAKVDRFTRAMAKNPGDAVLLGWLDGVTVKNELAKQSEVQLALADEGAVLSVSGDEAGVLTRVAGTLVGADIAATPLFFEPGKLDYPDSLPAETVAYLAMSTKTSLDGAGLEREFMALVKRKDAGAEADLRAATQQFQQMTGVSFADALGSIGDEIVIAGLAPSDMKVQGFDPEQLKGAGAVMALRLKNPVVAEKIVTQLRDQVLAKEMGNQLTVKGKGMVVQTPLGPDVVVETAFVDGQLVIAGGAKPMVDKALAALAGSGTRLGADEGHSGVRATLPKEASQLLWIDTGRLIDRMLAGNPALSAMSKQAGVSLDQIQLTGPNRLTTSAALTLRAQSQTWEFALDSTNFAHALGLVGGLGASAFMSGASTALAASASGLPTTPISAPGLAPGAGGASCDKAIQCCKVLMSKSGQPGSNCDALAMAPAASCGQAYEGYARAAKALGSSCD